MGCGTLYNFGLDRPDFLRVEKIRKEKERGEDRTGEMREERAGVGGREGESLRLRSLESYLDGFSGALI